MVTETEVEQSTIEAKPSEATDTQLVSQAKQELFGTPKAEQPKEEPKVEAEQGVEGEAVPEGETPKAEKEVVRKDPKEQAIGKLVRKNHALKDKNDALLKRIAELEKLKAEKPTPEKFPDPAKLQEETIVHRVKTEQEEFAINAEKSNLDQQEAVEFQELVKEQVKDFDRFAKNYQQTRDYIRQNEPALFAVATSSKIGPKILEAVYDHIYADPQKLSQWQMMSEDAKKAELVGLERSLIMQTIAPPTRSNAPKPVAPERVSDGTRAAPRSERELVNAAKRELFGR